MVLEQVFQAVTVCHVDAEAVSSEQRQRQPEHAGQLEQGVAQKQAKVQSVVIVFPAGDPEGPTERRQQQPMQADHLIAVLQ